MEILRQDLVKYCKQIGVIDIEIPELVFEGEKFKDAVRESSTRHYVSFWRAGGRHTKMAGICDIWSRTIFVNIRGRNRALRDLRHTLIHELCHYRWIYLSHPQLEKRVKLVLKDKQYPRKHITVPQLESKWC